MPEQRSILTPDQRLRVFVSSTPKDLVEERKMARTSPAQSGSRSWRRARALPQVRGDGPDRGSRYPALLRRLEHDRQRPGAMRGVQLREGGRYDRLPHRVAKQTGPGSYGVPAHSLPK